MSSGQELRIAQAPQRNNGKLRVAAILEAAAAVIDEKGFDGTAMAEITERSGPKIGSLCSNDLSSMRGYSPLVDFYAARGSLVIQPTHLDSRVLDLPQNSPLVDCRRRCISAGSEGQAERSSLFIWQGGRSSAPSLFQEVS